MSVAKQFSRWHLVIS